MNNSDAYKDFKFSKPIKVIKSKTKIKLSTKPIRHKSKTSRNTSRSLSQETINKVYERDWYKCIVEWCTNRNVTLPHHANFWIEANYSDNRNDVDQLVTLCQEHHYEIHHWKWQYLREYCKDYLDNFYKRWN